MFQPRRYMVELGAALGLYAGLLVAMNAAERAFQPEGAALMALALLPMLGALAAAWAILRALARMDELQRRIQFDAIAMAFLGTALITLGWGFAEGAGAPQLRAFMVWPIMGFLWGLGTAIAARRYK